MKKQFIYYLKLIFAVSTIFVLALSCDPGWPGEKMEPSGIIRTEKVITDEQFRYNILFGPVFRPEEGLTWEDAAAFITSSSGRISL